MDEATLYTLLKTINLPVAYHHFVAPPALPYIVYLLDNTDNFGADNKAYSVIKNFAVELYTTTKDPTSEALIEGLFDANDIFWDKTETYIESEDLYMVRYEI